MRPGGWRSRVCCRGPGEANHRTPAARSPCGSGLPAPSGDTAPGASGASFAAPTRELATTRSPGAPSSRELTGSGRTGRAFVTSARISCRTGSIGLPDGGVEHAQATLALQGLEGFEELPDDAPCASTTGPRNPDALPRPPRRTLRLPARAARGGRGRARRTRRPDRHADRRRQEPLLPAPGPGVAPPDHRRQPADRPDGRPVPCASPAAAHPVVDGRLGHGRRAQPRGARAGPGRPRPDRLLLARALRLDGVPRRPGAAATST